MSQSEAGATPATVPAQRNRARAERKREEQDTMTSRPKTAARIVYLADDQPPTPWVHRSGRESWHARKTGTEHWRGTMTTFQGEKIGTYTIRSRWATRTGHTRYAISATIAGIDYHGTTYGPSMCAHLRPYKQQRQNEIPQ